MLMTIGCQDQMGLVDSPKGDVGISATSTLPIQYNPGGSWFTYFNYMPPVVAPGADYLLSIGNDDGENGFVRVWNDATNLYVEYHALYGWKLSEVHVAVALTHDGIPHNKSGNLQPGQFPFPLNKQFSVVPPAATHLVTIPWNSAWNNPPDPGLFIVAHCIAFWVDPITGDTTWETGTGADSTPDNPFKTFKLPDFCVTIAGRKINQPRSYWDITLSGIGDESEGYNVWDGHWYGWCAQEAISWPGEGTPYEARLWNSLDPNLPADLQNPAWDNISWLINAYAGAQDSFQKYYEGPGSYTPEHFVYDMTQAIWYLLGDLPKPDWQPAQAMAENAEAHGDGYVPHKGEYVAVLADPCDPALETQLVFIEVDP